MDGALGEVLCGPTLSAENADKGGATLMDGAAGVRGIAGLKSETLRQAQGRLWSTRQIVLFLD